MTISSKRFPNIVFETYEMKNEHNGETLHVISHHNLQYAINHLVPGDIHCEYDFGDVQIIGDNHYVIKGWIRDDIRKVVDFGEVTENTLTTDISKNNPIIIARNRAFDRIAIEYLELPAKCYSNLEITPEDELRAFSPSSGKSSSTKASSASVRSILESKKQENSIDTVTDIDTSVSDEAAALPPSSSLDESVFESSNEAGNLNSECEELGKVVIGFWKYKNSTIEELFKTNINDMKWIAQSVSNKPVADQIRRYLNIKNIEWTKSK